MKDALKSSFYCDYQDPIIKEAAAILKSGDEDPVVVAHRSFYFVRDKLIFGFDLFKRKASETLRCGFGACWNKALLLTALLRCNQIPASFGSVPLKRTFIKPAIGAWHWLANNPYNHCLVHAYLNDRWIILDAVLDKITYVTLFRPAGVEWEIDWNGEDDVRLYTESVVGPPVRHSDIDSTLNNKVDNTELPRFMAVIGNRFINRSLWRKTGCRPNGCITDHDLGRESLLVLNNQDINKL